MVRNECGFCYRLSCAGKTTENLRKFLYFGGKDIIADPLPIFVALNDSVEDQLLCQGRYDFLYRAMTFLTDKERSLITELYFQDKVESTYTKEHSLSQKIVSKVFQKRSTCFAGASFLDFWGNENAYKK